LVDENEEWGQFLVDEVRKYGLNLPPYGSENAQEESRRLVTEFIDRKLAELVAPKGEGIEPASSKLFSQMNGADGIMALMTKSIAEKYGSVQSFTARIDKLLPRVLGAFMISRFSVLPTNPDFDFRVRLRMPGGVVKTNGLRDIDGRIIWAFSERDIAISGYSMWAQSIIIDRSSLKAIGLDKFPGHLSDVEHLNRLMRTGDKGEINADIQHALRQCIMVKSLSPLASLTKADEKTEISNAPLATTTDAAKKLLGLFESFAKDKKKTMEPELDGAQPAEPELGTSSLGAPGRHSDVDPTEEEKDGEK
jgi:hypothetical protein